LSTNHAGLSALPLPVVIVDLETTGGRAGFDRITEVGVVEIDAQGVREWSTLVNPQCRIPWQIERLTGISNAMVANAPTFAEIAGELHARLAGKTFIAHNVRFDHGFLRNEFERTGHSFRPQLLCSVKLSRALYPAQERHGLDALIERHQLAMQHRHRALDDARAVRLFIEAALDEHGPERVAAAVAQQLKRQTLPPNLDAAMLEGLPEAPGIYLFYGENDALLYIGKSKNIRSRVLAHFASDHASSKEMRLCQQTRRIAWEETAGELGALLLEARRIKEQQPLMNRRLRRQAQLCSLVLEEDGEGLLRPKTVFARDLEGRAPRLYGLFPSPAAAKKTLHELAVAQRLCLQATGLERAAGRACSARQVKKCAGFCEGAETPVQHNLRLLEALGDFALRAWPFAGPIGLIEESASSGLREVHVIDNWCWLGTARDDGEVHEILADPPQRAFDRDTYKLLVTALKNRVKTVPLASGDTGSRRR
jgi:DNA polymerase-3 subunit epsilon